MVHPGELYAFAHQFYWDLRRLVEGGVRRRFDEKKYNQLTADLEKRCLIDEEDRARHQRTVDAEIQSGRLDPCRREERLRDIEDSELSVRQESYRQEAAGESEKRTRIPGEPEVISILLSPNTSPEQIRELCKEAFMTRVVTIGSETREVEVPAWPIPVGSVLPTYLSQHAEQYIAALNDPRFPRCDVSVRPSNQLKQFWFLSRALAGAVHGVTTRTAINLVGSKRPEEVFHESRYAKPKRKRRKSKAQI